MKSPLIVALDFPEGAPALDCARRLDPRLCRIKIGKELFTAAGPRVVEDVRRLGFEVFLDLKYHDIPQTVAGACKAAAHLGVWMVNVHASGGPRMLRAAREALGDGAGRPLLVGVTVLTSMDAAELRAVGIASPPLEQVQRLATLTAHAGLDGVVCSPLETAILRASLPEGFLLVTPGVRPVGAAVNDQARVATPAQAMAGGSDFLVLGRPVTGAPDPVVVLHAVLAEIGVSDE